MNLSALLNVFWISFVASAVVAWPIYRWLKSTVKQKIDPHLESHQSKQGTPTMGGLIILVGAIVSLLVVGFAPGWTEVSSEVSAGTSTQLPAYVLLLIGFAIVGFVDDFVVPRMYESKRGLGWKQKLALEIVVAAAACYVGNGSRFDALTLVAGTFLILFYSNAYNFGDGLDGLAGSLWAGLALGLVLLADGSQLAVQLASLAILGGVVSFLFLNSPPAKVFMGDVGSLPIGAVLGYAVYSLGFRNEAGSSTFVAPMVVPILLFSFVMIAELVPVPMQVAYFKLTKGKRLFPRTPIHHAFELKGWKESKVVWTFALVQVLLSLAAVTVHQLSK